MYYICVTPALHERRLYAVAFFSGLLSAEWVKFYFMSSIGNYHGTPEMQELIAKHKKEKAFAITKTMVNLANTIVNITKTLPKDGKRNPFTKSYNRRPRSKKKRALAFAQIAINTMLAQSQAHMIASQPIPKFKNGSPGRSGGIAVIGPNNTEVIQRVNGEIIPILPMH